MQVVKYMLLLLVFSASAVIGVLLGKRYSNRVNELKEIRNCLNIFKTKIKFTYEPIPELFKEIATTSRENIANIFNSASQKMQYTIAGQAWIEALEEANTNMTREDLTVLKSLSKLLGKTDVEGQISEIELTSQFIDTQIEKAEKEKSKNEKLYKTLGIVTGMAITILLI